MPNWVMWLLFGIGALAILWGFAQAKVNKLPSGNVATQPATLNPTGNQYGNLT
jgi:hypothetical protein